MSTVKKVAALEQPMKDAAQQVLDIREEVVTASQNAVQTADDAKTIARAAESSLSGKFPGERPPGDC